MRIVALEEHFHDRALGEKHFGIKSSGNGHPPIVNPGMTSPELIAELDDLGAGRLASMDEAGISIQVVSASMPGADMLDGQDGIDFARATNDRLANAVAENPNRLAGFAHLPMRTPTAAAEELERAVKTLGFRGACINGTTNGLFLDDPSFAPVLKTAASLQVPIYLHPNMPPKAVLDAYYGGLPERIAMVLASGAYGWYSETGLHILRLAAAGIFDEHPALQMIIGHMGETLPFALLRAADSFERFKLMERNLADVVREHLHITTSAFFTIPPFLNAMLVFGIDRMMFSVDYPYLKNNRGRAYLDSLPISPTDKEKLAFRNADALLKLSAS